MKLLLTSAGIKNASINGALVELLGKPVSESNALCFPTATYAMGGPGSAWRFITGRASTPMCELGWKSLGVLELTALPSIDDERWGAIYHHFPDGKAHSSPKPAPIMAPRSGPGSPHLRQAPWPPRSADRPSSRR